MGESYTNRRVGFDKVRCSYLSIQGIDNDLIEREQPREKNRVRRCEKERVRRKQIIRFHVDV